MSPVLDVVPGAYRTAARRVGDDAATLLRLASAQLTDALGGTDGMAGSDDCGRQWGDSYDSAAQTAFGAMVDAHNAMQVVAELLDQTGANYAAAESTSTGSPIVGREFSARLVDALGFAPSAVGQTGVDMPAGWGLIQRFVRRMWPNGHQDRLHRAGDAWHHVGAELVSLQSELDDAAMALSRQLAPEIPDAIAVVDSLHDQVIALGNACTRIGDACHGYAHNPDEAHHRIIQALEQLLHDTVETAVIGTLIGVVTAGAGAIAAGVAETAALRNVAEAISAIIDMLMAAAVSVAAEADVAAMRIGEIADVMRPMFARQLHEAELVQSRIHNDGLIVGRVLPAANSPIYAADSTTVSSTAFAQLQAEAESVGATSNVGKLSIDDIYADPVNVLSGKTPAQIERMLGDHEGWRVETLGRGRHKSQGWLLRKYSERGFPTGPQIRWHPGGGHHGPEPYWRVIGSHGDLYGEIR